MAKTTKPRSKTTASRKRVASTSTRRAASKATKGAAAAKKSPRTESKSKEEKAIGEKAVTIDRRRNPDRRQSAGKQDEGKSGGAKAPKVERRNKVSRRRQIDPTTCERDYTNDEVEFMNALDRYKRTSGRMFPTCSEVLEVVKGLGYKKHVGPTEFPDSSSPQGESPASEEAAGQPAADDPSDAHERNAEFHLESDGVTDR